MAFIFRRSSAGDHSPLLLVAVLFLSIACKTWLVAASRDDGPVELASASSSAHSEVDVQTSHRDSQGKVAYTSELDGVHWRRVATTAHLREWRPTNMLQENASLPVSLADISNRTMKDAIAAEVWGPTVWGPAVEAARQSLRATTETMDAERQKLAKIEAAVAHEQLNVQHDDTIDTFNMDDLADGASHLADLAASVNIAQVESNASDAVATALPLSEAAEDYSRNLKQAPRIANAIISNYHKYHVNVHKEIDDALQLAHFADDDDALLAMQERAALRADDDEARNQAAEEAKRKAEEEAEEARIQAAEEAKRKAEEEAEEARIQAAEEAKRKAEEDAERRGQGDLVKSFGTYVTGKGTAFGQDVAVGDSIFCQEQERTVISIANSVTLEVDSPFDPGITSPQQFSVVT